MKKNKMERTENNQNSEVSTYIQKAEVILWEIFISEVVSTPSNLMKEKSRKKLNGDLYGLSKIEKDEITNAIINQYPNMKPDLALTEGSWSRLNPEEKKNIVCKISQEKNRVIKSYKPLLTIIHLYEQDSLELDNQQIQLAGEIYQILQSEVKVENMQSNKINNELLAQKSLEAALNKNLLIWRFVCLPEIQILTEKSKFKEWIYKFGGKRYDTLSPTLNRDQEIISRLTELGIGIDYAILMDDWEAPWLRSRKDFFALPREERKSALVELSMMRNDIKDWINGIISQTNLPIPEIIFISDYVDFEEFTDLINELKIEDKSLYQGIFNTEVEFVSKSSPQLTSPQREIKAGERIEQYAVEGSIISASPLIDGVYLNSEYPVQQVWKKLTLLDSKIATLFYVTDKEIKNV